MYVNRYYSDSAVKVKVVVMVERREGGGVRIYCCLVFFCVFLRSLL